VPRTSLMAAIRHEVFDDLLIGNFMKTTLIGKWPGSRLHPYFTPVVAKYADNAHAYSAADLDAYFHSYRARAGRIHPTPLAAQHRADLPQFRQPAEQGLRLRQAGVFLH
jgi:hypothetical protein